jgi:trimethylamine--corrinoid protein Co-methyltransferase
MILTGSTHRRTPVFSLLAEDQIDELIRAVFWVMEKVGFTVLHAGAREMLRRAGALVAEERVRVPEFVVRGALASAPRGWTLYDRNGARAIDVEGRKSYYGTSTASPNTKDALTGEVRPTRVADIALAARVADALEHIDWVMPMGSCQDVPARAAELYEFHAAVTNTVKPIVFLSYSPRGAELVFEMAAAVAGGRAALREKPFIVLYPESISPLTFPAEVVDRMFAAADWGLPQMMGPSIQPGATGPVTLAGAVVQGMAESLMGVVLAQLRRPGCPVGAGCNFAIMDMATGLTAIAAPEMSVGLAAQAEVARRFGLPTWGLAGCTDAKVVDAQAGAESAFGILAQGLAGLNLIHDVGYMDNAMVCSVAQLLLGNEIIGMTKRFLRPFAVDAEAIGREVIAAVGPGGNFIEQKHTFDHFRRELYRPKLFTRQHTTAWLKEGSKDAARRIEEEIRRIEAGHRPAPLADPVRSALERIVTEGRKELEG